VSKRNVRRERLSWGEQRELQALPQRLEKLSSEIAELERRLGDAGFYARDPKAFAIATQRLEQAAHERATAGRALAGARGEARAAGVRNGLGRFCYTCRR
jgi:hypothetical protein